MVYSYGAISYKSYEYMYYCKLYNYYKFFKYHNKYNAQYDYIYIKYF